MTAETLLLCRSLAPALTALVHLLEAIAACPDTPDTRALAAGAVACVRAMEGFQARILAAAGEEAAR
jgi:hypothetical protein